MTTILWILIIPVFLVILGIVILDLKRWGNCRIEGCLFVGKLADNRCIKHFDSYRKNRGDR